MTSTRPRRFLMLGAGAVAASLILSGCAASSTESEDGGTTIQWWSWNPDAESNVQWVDAFEAEHPDIDVEFRFIQFSDYVNTVRLAAGSSSGPDVFGIQPGALTQQFAALATDLTPYAEEEIGDDWKTQLLQTDQLAADGKQVGLPWMITGGGLVWYNQAIFEEAGVQPPTTLDEWEAACAAIEDIGKTCLAQGSKDDWANIDIFQAIANEIAPGEFSRALDGEAAFDSDVFVEAFDAWKNLFDVGIIDEGALGMTAYPDANDAFLKGDAAMIAFGTWNDDRMSSTTLEGLTGTYGDQIVDQVFLPISFPDVVDGAVETGRLFGGPDVGWAVSQSSEHQDAAFELVKWLSASETGQQMIAQTMQTPALASVPVASTTLVDADVQQPALDEQATQIADLIGPRAISDADVQTALGQALASTASGQTSSADAAADVQSAIDAAE